MKPAGTSVRIRDVVTADAAALTAVMHSVGWFDSQLPVGREEQHAQVAAHLAEISNSPEHDILVGEVDGDGVMGYVSMHRLPYLFMPTPEGFVSELFIHADCRGHGLGGRLLAAAERLARDRGWSRLHLVNSRQHESYQRGFYAANGWEERPHLADFVIRLPR